MKQYKSPDFCADKIDVLTNFAVIMNVFIRRVHCILLLCSVMEVRVAIILVMAG